MSIFQRKLIYLSFCIVWGVITALIELYFNLVYLSVTLGTGIPFFIIFKPWKYVYGETNERS